MKDNLIIWWRISNNLRISQDCLDISQIAKSSQIFLPHFINFYFLDEIADPKLICGNNTRYYLKVIISILCSMWLILVPFWSIIGLLDIVGLILPQAAWRSEELAQMLFSSIFNGTIQKLVGDCWENLKETEIYFDIQYWAAISIWKDFNWLFGILHISEKASIRCYYILNIFITSNIYHKYIAYHHVST